MDANKLIEKTTSFKVNGKQIELTLPPTYRLVDILRDSLSLTGTKVACEVGRCGACSVIMNGKLVNSCLIMAYQMEDAEIFTIESLSEERLHPIQEAFLQAGALQCGYCTPGMIIALKSLLDEEEQPSKEDVLTALSGNLCRCTGYEGILRAVDLLTKKRHETIGEGKE
ncbi:(2Fe-2S)-binding protein [Niallia sp. FSL W8-0635]|uniref:(2Fe-2S)-binding protein n=1 Tax=Niallia sp. FSL W8-0635 TaxID=2975337 RepID=UPI0009CD69DB|nr:aerobic-type carbon monoxide dehydrogenase, small subunit CoxS/CutS-like protein [Mycobacteroides abscessus subsp. abscessus]HEO8418271.1 (2Fe-2S)-binding protein [Yersinia enterocolitica]